ncbi:hypothetical protein TTHERM_000490999 (macronuclear) [Tetrahymena thermophila SB210]|uniref:Kinase domain protein n=1 Tax=Tetrahymena thermophila (strain SB210) TaxID=312017 RepID=W7XHZ7_TETTS|nr:hypothetical protein TTHERM_000490999 [Tetrahymena thermophila SB210]EWS74206.1 hypothetical protein TTHERM_000490999 [Tetrahymena thermophila SB210]|eukprot:XP_012653266.1 hypothetical protein TTHERM_000490999 [Tetrahymena thermophila SB210]
MDNNFIFQELNQRIEGLLKLDNEIFIQQIIEKIQDEQIGLITVVTELYSCNLETILKINAFKYDQIVALTYQLLNNLLTIQNNNLTYVRGINPNNVFYSKSTNQFLIEIVDYTYLNIINNPNTQNTLAVSLQDNPCQQSINEGNKQNSRKFVFHRIDNNLSFDKEKTIIQ